MTGDFPDRDEWTDRVQSGFPAPEKCEQCGMLAEKDFGIAFWIDGAKACRCSNRKLAAEAEQAMEDAEWDSLGATDLLSAEELADLGRVKPTDLSNNQFSDV